MPVVGHPFLVSLNLLLIGGCGLSKGYRANLLQAITTWFQPSSERLREIGISPATLHRVEMAEENVTLRNLGHLADWFRCKISELLGEER